MKSTSVSIGQSSVEFQNIHRAEIELVIWRRTLPRQFDTALRALPAHRFPEGRQIVNAPAARAEVEVFLAATRMPMGTLSNLLRDDIASLIGTFAEVMKIDEVDMRLGAIQNDACWKFHRDCVRARLLTTYRGPGTQWVEPAHSEAALREQRDFRSDYEEFSRYDVGLFKGDCAPPAKGIVHRSPPINGSGQTRLVFCLNIPS